MTGEEIRKTVMDYPFLEKRTDGLYVTDKKLGSRKIIFLTLGGSYAYGTNVENINAFRAERYSRLSVQWSKKTKYSALDMMRD